MTNQKRQRQIRAAMILRGISGADIARRLGITSNAVCIVIAGRGKSRRIIEALVEAGVPEKLVRHLTGKREAKHDGEK